MGILTRIFGFLKLAWAATASENFGAVLASAVKYGPLIAEVIELIEKKESDTEQQEAATQFERGFRVLNQTKNPKPLMDAIYSHCGRNGCVLP